MRELYLVNGLMGGITIYDCFPVISKQLKYLPFVEIEHRTAHNTETFKIDKYQFCNIVIERIIRNYKRGLIDSVSAVTSVDAVIEEILYSDFNTR